MCLKCELRGKSAKTLPQEKQDKECLWRGKRYIYIIFSCMCLGKDTQEAGRSDCLQRGDQAREQVFFHCFPFCNLNFVLSTEKKKKKKSTT